MHIAYLLTGSNMGNRSSFLLQASSLIKTTCGKIVQQSALYETAPWGFLDQPPFINQALVVETILDPMVLMQELLKIETQMGRKRTIKLGPRIIDLDILLIDDYILKSSLLEIPHPALPNRRFALLPLAEIAPNLVHPILQKTISELLHNCTDHSDVQKKLI